MSMIYLRMSMILLENIEGCAHHCADRNDGDLGHRRDTGPGNSRCDEGNDDARRAGSDTDGDETV
jgi:hypothetical protein